jgi:XTP/dITP diphosphohydrolase
MDSEHLSILYATTNRGKLAEARVLLADLPIEILSLEAVLPNQPPVVEDGSTFEENALRKARAAAEAAMMVTLAEDAGLEVDALGGRPGVRSARFAKEGATDAENNAALLAALEEIEDEQRTARFRCVLVLIDPWGDKDPAMVVEGCCEGSIARQARGMGGFGYDPLFIVQGRRSTMAELAEDDKNRVSHRAAAVAAMCPALETLLENRIQAVARVLGGR